MIHFKLFECLGTLFNFLMFIAAVSIYYKGIQEFPADLVELIYFFAS